MHEKVATRFGVSTAFSPEERFTDGTTGATGNTTIRLADSLNVFDTGSLAPGVTVQTVDYRLLSLDAGHEVPRLLPPDGALHRGGSTSSRPTDRCRSTSINDKGFYVQTAFYPIPKKLELYAATSQIYGDKDAGFGNSYEYLVGMNFYPFNTRNYRLNLQVMDVNRSPVSSTFGYYVGGQDGTTVSTAFSVFF